MAEAVTVDLDSLKEESDLSAWLSTVDASTSPLVEVSGSLEGWERVRAAMMALRAANLSPCLLLKRGELALEDEELQVVLGYLKLWDQLTLHNFLELCGEWLPEGAAPHFQIEAKMELKWFREWLTAAADERLHKYPGLPWRRFIRKINAENHAFVTRFLELAQRPATPEANAEMESHLKAFLLEKKKVVNLFPKRWNKGH